MELGFPIRVQHGTRLWFGSAAALLLALFVLIGPSEGRSTGGCDATMNEIACENLQQGAPRSEWQVSGAGDPSIQGFATQISARDGETVDFKIKTDAAAYRIDIYRLGWYDGDGARLVDTVVPSAALPQTQPECAIGTTTGLIDCGTWGVSASWTVPIGAVSGVYLARLVRTDTGGASHIIFVVRDDEGHSDLLVQTSDTTWTAYNAYGGMNTYAGNSTGTSWWTGKANKVSYNRPLTMRDYQSKSNFFHGEYPMLRWLERNGYDVSYTSGVDTSARGDELLEHKVFVSVGHDEYWSAEQRANVERARDAGVNLAFFSGNEMFWKLRWEPSIDGSSAANRTLVVYKETASNAKTDPSPIWTGTWRDPRFSPPSDGGRPENAVTGQLFTVNAFRNDPIYVPAEDGRLRFWRNTGVDTLAPGQRAELPTGVLGYEWDEDIDNGFRPPGLFRLSSTTFNVSSYLLNYGSVYGDGTAHHSLTLYRAASGALVFGAGTVQWSWGLDGEHDNPSTDADPRMRQATVNLFADMGVQPQTLQAGITPATASTDTVAPSATISSPAAGTAFPRGQLATVSGTATDTGGGVVGGVEVSIDGGTTWHPATSGREQWTYSWVASGYGAITLVARAVDDSGNLGAVSALVPASVGGCPCSIWSDATQPTTAAASDTQAYELGLKFRTDVSGYVTGVRFYKGPGNGGTHLGHLWSTAGAMLGEVVFSDETATGWQQAWFGAPIAVTAGTTYIVSYWAPQGRYALNRPGFTTAVVNAPVRALADGADGPNAVFKSGTSAFPTQSNQASNYWVDVVFEETGVDRVAPRVLSTKPASGAVSVGLSPQIEARFDEPMDPASVTPAAVELRSSSGVVPATVSYDAATRAMIATPSARLAAATDYTVTVRAGGVRDAAGNPLASDKVWSFRTFTCPCSLWGAGATPAETSYYDTAAYELGVKFRSELNGFITSIRFYKGAGNGGTHVGHLWNAATGSLLGEVTFTGESATGWQQATFSAPVAVQAGATYIASYFAPQGRYALTRPGFTAGVDTGPLHALANGVEGGNGIFKSGGVSGFPTQSNQASNYWVDVVFEETGVDHIAPRASSTKPDGSSTVGLSPVIQATFDEALDPASVTPAAAELRSSAGVVAAAVAYNGATRSVTITPAAPLATATTYTATLRAGGVRDVAGNALTADISWSFSTFACPCSVWSAATTPATTTYSDFQAYELGFKFRSDLSGYITAVKFYKGAGNGGTHVGHLWTTSGTMLGEVTFTGETATGWQQATFSQPIPVTAGTTYIASYWDPQGRYALNRPGFATAVENGPLRALSDAESGGNGVFKSLATGFPNKSNQASNYWIDVVFEQTPVDHTGPSVASTKPAGGAVGVGVTPLVQAKFDEPLDPSSVNGANVELRSAGGVVQASLAYDDATRTVTITPVSRLASATTYTATVRAGGVRDLAGNAIGADASWSFTTFSCPCSVWSSVVTPAEPAYSDFQAYELGFKLRSDVDGTITGVRFYKGTGNGGTHLGHVWTTSGLMLGEVVFTGESATGWQQASFATPIPVTAGTTYIVSYFAPQGRYALNRPGFATSVDNGPLHALADGVEGGNGVFRSVTTGFPTKSNQASNYWADVVFAAGS